MHDARPLRTIEASAVFLFLLQSVRILFSVLFGIIYDTVFEETFPLAAAGAIFVAVVAALLTPLAAPRRGGSRLLSAVALVAALARVPATFNLPSVRLWASIVVIGAAGLYAATLVRREGSRFAPALVAALVADQFLRTAGNTFDLALRPWWWPVQLALAVGVGWLGWQARSAAPGDQQGEAPPNGKIRGERPLQIGLGGGLAVGALLFLECSLLDSPNGVARWSDVPYGVAAPLLMAATLLPLFPVVRRGAARVLRGSLGGLAHLFLALAGVAAGRTVGGGVGLAGLLVAQFLLLLVPFQTYRRSDRGRFSQRYLALGFLLFLVLNLAMAFAFTYPYTVPAFRGMGLPILLVATLVAALPAVRTFAPSRVRTERRRLWGWLVTALLVASSAVLAWPRPVAWQEGGPVRAGTYNVHYGFNTPWQLSLEEIARTIEESGADVMMLQEVDTCRITSYGIDDALWLARRLGMAEIYQPTLEGLSGIALLSRYPVVVAGGALLGSELEQTGIVHARVRVGGREVDAYGIWLGLAPEERARQLSDALAFVGAASPALLGGDLNATPDSPVYTRLAEADFVDPFVALGLGDAPTSPAVEPHQRIDFVWGRGLEPVDGAVLDSLASDHRMVITEWRLP